MQHPLRNLLLAAAAASLPLTTAAPPPDGFIASPEPDWPQWRGPRRDGICVQTGLLPRWPDGGPKLVWKTTGLGKGWSSPIVIGDRLYITGDRAGELVIFAYNREGRLVWHKTNGKAWRSPYPGARASCTFSEGRLYHLNAHGRLACLDAAAGAEQWSVNILERFGGANITWALSESVLVDGPRVVVTPGGTKALMAALDKRTGKTVWATAPRQDARASHTSPILLRYGGRRLITNCSSAHGFGVDADTGELMWTVPLRNQFGVNATSPVYGFGKVFYVTPYAELGRLYELRPSGKRITAEPVWTCPLDSVTGGALLVGKTLVAAGYKKSKWWFAVDWRTGRTTAELKDFTTGAALWADGRIYCFDETGAVGLLQLDKDGLSTVSRFRLLARRAKDAWAHPVIHDGRLYLRYHDTLWCYDIKKP